jgi:chlorite dismutase
VAEAPGTLEGWYALHDFRRIDWSRLSASDPAGRNRAASEAESFLASAQSLRGSSEGGSAAYRILGHKADLLFLHLRPTLEELSDLERRLEASGFAGFCSRPYSYLSAVELSLYEASARAGTEDESALMQQPFVRKRLFPEIPTDKPYLSFYPMNKRRGETVNWYTDTMEERRRMMREHGSTGRQFTDRIQQMITGSMGLDDWEWGVTLFATDPLALKKLVAAMRFDEVSARYAEFGPFYTGLRLTPESLHTLLARNPE